MIKVTLSFETTPSFSGMKVRISLPNEQPALTIFTGYYRGYFELHITAEKIDAYYFGCPTVATRNPFEISLANFTVIAGRNRLQRPVAGGSVESGSLQGGKVEMTNLTLNTETGKYLFTKFDQMFIDYSEGEE